MGRLRSLGAVRAALRTPAEPRHCDRQRRPSNVSYPFAKFPELLRCRNQPAFKLLDVATAIEKTVLYSDGLGKAELRVFRPAPARLRAALVPAIQVWAGQVFNVIVC